MKTIAAHSPFLRTVGGSYVLAVPQDATNEDILIEVSASIEAAQHYLNVLADSNKDKESIIAGLYGVMRYLEISKGLIDSVEI